MSTRKEELAKLPSGKTCGDCAHFERCRWLFQCKPKAEACDFIPSRFLEKRSNDQEPAP